MRRFTQEHTFRDAHSKADANSYTQQNTCTQKREIHHARNNSQIQSKHAHGQTCTRPHKISCTLMQIKKIQSAMHLTKHIQITARSKTIVETTHVQTHARSIAPVFATDEYTKH